MTTINTNTNALAVKNAAVINQRDMAKAMEQLSTGRRINSASDDAAGLSIRNKMSSQILSLGQAVRNANDGISMLQTADGATAEVTSMLIRMRELSIQSANDIYTDEQRNGLNAEVTELKAELLNVLENTEWNGTKFLKGEAGSAGSVIFQVGASATDQITLTMSDLSADADVSAIQSIDITTQSGANTAIGDVDLAIAFIDSERSKWGAVTNRLTHSADNAINVSMNSKAARSRIDDADYAQATAELARSMILDQAGAAMLSQANQQPMYVLALLR
jgi:flagellin